MRRTLLSLMLPLAMVPAGWPHHVALGVSDPPGDALALRAHAPVDVRYQYLAGGVNTGHGWATWNPNGSFVSMYVRESLAAHLIPVFSYYQMLQSAPSVGGTEQARDLSNMRNLATMKAYWADYQPAVAAGGCVGRVAPGRDPRRAGSVGLPGAGPCCRAGAARSRRS